MKNKEGYIFEKFFFLSMMTSGFRAVSYLRVH